MFGVERDIRALARTGVRKPGEFGGAQMSRPRVGRGGRYEVDEICGGARARRVRRSRERRRRRTKPTVGISMPTKSSARWIADGDNMVKVLQAKGYNTDLQYADDDIPTQLTQIENMITKKEKVLVIAAIDGTTLSNALQKAADQGIKVISYDRLIVGSPNVDYYATFDNFQVGVEQARDNRPRPRPRRRQDRPVQYRAVRRLARRHQRLLLLRWGDVGASAVHRQGNPGRTVEADGHGQNRNAALEGG